MPNPSPSLIETADAALAAGAFAPTSVQRFTQSIWPMCALLVAELLAILVLAPPQLAELNPITLSITTIVLLVGIAPNLLRPSAAANLVACCAIVLTSALWRAPQMLGTLLTIDAVLAALGNNPIRLMLLNSVLLAPLTLHLATLFPQRGTLSNRVILGAYILTVGATLATWLLPFELRLGALVGLILMSYAGFGMAGWQFLRTIQRFQPAYPRAGQQARLVLLILVLAEAPLLLLPVRYFIPLSIPYEWLIGAQVVLPIGLAYTITRQDLFGIDAALRRTLDYTAVSFGLLVIYFGLTTLVTQLSRDLGGTWGYAATLMSVIAAAAAFTPLRRSSERLIDRIFFPERLAFGQALSAAHTQLALVVQREAVIHLLDTELPRQIGASWASLVLRPAFDQPNSATQPGVWSTLLLVGGQPVGSYWLGPRHSGLGYTTDEQEQLRSLLQQAALALAYAETFDSLVQLNHELEERVATRTEHVLAQQRELAAFEERQRLARDLHDSVKQTLFSLGLGLRAVRSRMNSDPETALALLQQQEQEALQAQAAMGDLLTQLRTSATEYADLSAILLHYTTWLEQQHGLHVACDLPTTLVLREALARELAQVAKEALHNVLRHSGVQAAQLSLTWSGNQLTLMIADQGHGFDQTQPQAGYGLRGMRERMSVLGGSLQIQTEPHKGTSIWVQIRVDPV